MTMTDTERREYNSQPKEWRDEFDRNEKDHPYWNYTQCSTMATIATEVGGIINPGPGIIETVLIKACDYMKVNCPDTFTKVARVFDTIIDLAKRKIINSWKKVMEWFNSL